MEVFTASNDIYVLRKDDKRRIKKRIYDENEKGGNVYFDGTELIHELPNGEVERVDFNTVFDDIKNHKHILEKEYGLQPIYTVNEISSDTEQELENNR
jgi:hypothetical protein